MLEGFTDKPPAQATMTCIQWFFNGVTAEWAKPLKRGL